MTGPAAEPQKNPSGSDETFNDTEKQVYGVPQDTKVNDALEMSPEGEFPYKRLLHKDSVLTCIFDARQSTSAFGQRLTSGSCHTSVCRVITGSATRSNAHAA